MMLRVGLVIGLIVWALIFAFLSWALYDGKPRTSAISGVLAIIALLFAAGGVII